MRLFLLAIFVLSTTLFAENQLLEAGTPAPTFVMNSTTGGREYLRVWSGERLMKLYLNNKPRRVILSFWSTTCTPCLKEVPELQHFITNHEEDSMKVFLVNLDRHSAPELNNFASEHGWTLPILQDPYQNTAGRYGVEAIPTIYVISPEGFVEHAFTGIPEGETADSYLEKLIYPQELDIISDSTSSGVDSTIAVVSLIESTEALVVGAVSTDSIPAQ